MLNHKAIMLGLSSLIVLGAYLWGHSSGYDKAVKEYQETVIVNLKKQAEENASKKDATINLLLTEGNSIRSDLDKSLGRLWQLSKDNKRLKANNPTDTTRVSLERCREFNLEGAELLKQALEGYRRESLRVDSLNTLIKEEEKK